MTDTLAFICPGRSAARSDALQTRDRNESGHWNGPGPAAHHFVLRRVRDTSSCND